MYCNMKYLLRQKAAYQLIHTTFILIDFIHFHGFGVTGNSSNAQHCNNRQHTQHFIILRPPCNTLL